MAFTPLQWSKIAKLDLAKIAIDKWGGDNYQNTYNEVEKYYKKGTLPDYSDYSSLLVQGGEPKDNYTIFQGIVLPI